MVTRKSTPKTAPAVTSDTNGYKIKAEEWGFTQCDILATLLSKNEVSHRVKAMAVQACEAAGNEAIGRIFDAMRGKGKDGGGRNP